MTIEAVIWDFGGVFTTSPFEAFNRFEVERGLTKDSIRRINANMCELLGVRPQACVYLDDLGINCKPAAALGMRAIKVIGEDQALADLSAATGLRLGREAAA